MFLNIHYDPYHCTVGHRYTVVLLLLLSKIQFFFPPALLDSKAKMLTIFFCSWPWSCDSSSRLVTDWMRLLIVDTMMNWMFHASNCHLFFIFPQYQACRENVMNWEAMFSSSVLQSFSLPFFSRLVFSSSILQSFSLVKWDWQPVSSCLIEELVNSLEKQRIQGSKTI